MKTIWRGSDGARRPQPNVGFGHYIVPNFIFKGSL